MNRAKVFNYGKLCGYFEEIEQGKSYKFSYLEDYIGKPVSLTMPINKKVYNFDEFPPFFDGLLPEGFNLDALCRQLKIDKTDYFKQLLAVGRDVVGSVTVEADNE
ncbi:MAG TPA: HipA N-terminal domain-containing protein [Melioribacteraceae bacterium]|nr:HipA N-terminal domain-containing protein [Melioribacteraceae bacterium]